MNRLTQTLVLCMVFLMTNACSNKVAQSKKYYRIPTIAATESQPLQPITLVIKRPKALSILGGRPMVATQDDDSLVQLSHHFWIESPKVMLQDILKDWASNYWQSVSYQTPSDAAYQILDSRIISFEKRQNEAKIVLEFTLYDDDYQVIFNQQYERTQNINGERYRAFTQAVGKALESILAELAEQL